MTENLEHAVLYAASQGSITPEQLKPHINNFSKEGKVFAQALEWLGKQGQKPPYTAEGLILTCSETLGQDKDTTTSYVKDLMTHVVGKEITAVLQSAVDRLKLMDIHKIAADQLAKSTFDPFAFQTVLKQTETSRLSNLSQQMKQGEEHGAARIALGEELESIQQQTGGLGGFWVLGGMQGSGKSTLAWQISLRAGESRPVLYYDMENTPWVLFERTRDMFGGDLALTNDALRQIFVRNDPRTLWRDLLHFDQPTVIVVDSLQAIPQTDKNGKQENIESWLSKLDRLKHDQHHIIAVSQLTRGSNTFKWTNDIEHKADFALRLESPASNPLSTKVYIEKNRHGVKRGFLCMLTRENNWVFRG